MSIVMLQSNLALNVIDIEGASTAAGAGLDAYPPAVDTIRLGTTQTPFAANQAWEVVADPLGSSHYIIKNPGTGHCIDIVENSVRPGANLDAYPVKSSNNENQLWDFILDPFGSGCYFIQSPQTGYVIDLKDGSSAAKTVLEMNPRRLFDNKRQLWSAIEQGTFQQTTLPAVSMAPAPSQFGSNNQYVLLAPNQTTNITSFEVTIDVIEDLVCPSFSVQINGNAPSPSDGSGKKWDAQWTQFGLMMQSNSLALLNQAWHALGADTKGDPLASVTEVSATMLTLENNTVPAGTKIVLTLTLDSSDDNFSTAISGKIFQNGVAVGTPVNWPLIGQPTFNPGGPVKEADLSPLGAVSVVIVGPPGGTANFSSGMGTITVNCAPKLTVSSDLNGPNPHGIQTAEQSNCWYGQVQAGSFTQIVQPFGVLSPKITGIGGVNNVSGTGLYPNSTLKVTAFFSGSGYGETNGVVGELAPVAHDGSFGFGVTPQNPAANYNPGTLTVKVSDSVGNSVEGVVGAGGPGFPVVISSTGTPRQNW